MATAVSTTITTSSHLAFLRDFSSGISQPLDSLHLQEARNGKSIATIDSWRQLHGQSHVQKSLDRVHKITNRNFFINHQVRRIVSKKEKENQSEAGDDIPDYLVISTVEFAFLSTTLLILFLFPVFVQLRAWFSESCALTFIRLFIEHFLQPKTSQYCKDDVWRLTRNEAIMILFCHEDTQWCVVQEWRVNRLEKFNLNRYWLFASWTIVHNRVSQLSHYLYWTISPMSECRQRLNTKHTFVLIHMH